MKATNAVVPASTSSFSMEAYARQQFTTITIIDRLPTHLTRFKRFNQRPKQQYHKQTIKTTTTTTTTTTRKPILGDVIIRHRVSGAAERCR
jgi:hypothetical protein